MLERIVSYDRGQLIPVFALSLVVLMGMSALAVDVGYWRYQQRLEQTAADSAALAGADELNYPAANDVATTAQNAATANGFTNGVANTTVVVNSPPLSGPNTGNTLAVEVIISKLQPHFFEGIFGISQTVSTRAVAIQSAVSRGCIVGLSLVTTPAVTINGSNSAGVHAPGCDILSNSGMTFNLSGSSNVTADGIGMVGTETCTCSSTNPFPEGQPGKSVPVADPCASVPGCAYLKAHSPPDPPASTCLTPTNFNISQGTITVPAGTYCQQLVVQSSGGADVVFQSGIYVLQNGMKIQGSNTVSDDGSGITFYVSGGVFQVDLSGQSTLNLSPPLTGNTAGILLYQTPSDTNGASVVGSGVSDQVGGMLYVPKANLAYTVSGNSQGANPMLVANTVVLTVSNVAGINVPTPAPGATPEYAGFSHATLSE